MRLLCSVLSSHTACCVLCQVPVMEMVAEMRSRRRGDLVEDRAALLRLGAVCSALARERSQKIIPLSVAARSVSWLMQRVPTRVWTVCLLPHTVSFSPIACAPCSSTQFLLLHTFSLSHFCCAHVRTSGRASAEADCAQGSMWQATRRNAGVSAPTFIPSELIH